MPLTFSHPALIVPLMIGRRHYFSATGLVMGSLAPDFEYFLRMKKGMSLYSHTFPALFWFNLPLALLLALLFHAVVKKPLLHSLPGWLFKRLSAYESFEWYPFFKRKWLLVLVSILIGAASHLLWDWFTHYSVIFADDDLMLNFALFGRNVSIYVYTIIHIAYSLCGLIVLFIFVKQLPINNHKKSFPDKFFWSKIFVSSILIFLTRYTFASSMTLDDLAVASIAAVLLALTLISIICQFNEGEVLS